MLLKMIFKVKIKILRGSGSPRRRPSACYRGLNGGNRRGPPERAPRRCQVDDAPPPSSERPLPAVHRPYLAATAALAPRLELALLGWPVAAADRLDPTRPGGERVYVQAGRDLEKLVKADESDTIGGNLTKVARLNEMETTGANRTIAVGANRTATIGAIDAAIVGARHAVTIARAPGAQGIAATGIEMVDRKITLSTGEATITLEGPNITLAAAAGILLEAASTITVHARRHIQVAAGASVTIEAKDGDVLIQGAPMVRINPEVGGAEQDDEDDDENDDDDR